MNFKELFDKFTCNTTDKMRSVFQRIKPVMIDNLVDYLIVNRKGIMGRPIKINFDNFMDALYFVVESGAQLKYVTQFGISKTTFHRYLTIISEQKIIEHTYFQLIHDYIQPDPKITDTMSVKSMRGSIGLGRNPTDRGRKGLKVSLICNLDRITTAAHVDACNVHDTQMLIRTIDKQPQQPVLTDCLCDAGYVGRSLAKYCRSKNYRMVAKPRRTRSKTKMTHVLSAMDTEHLQHYRNRIELLNQNIRRYRGLMIKWVQSISVYQCYLFLVLSCISCYQILTTL